MVCKKLLRECFLSLFKSYKIYYSYLNYFSTEVNSASILGDSRLQNSRIYILVKKVPTIKFNLVSMSFDYKLENKLIGKWYDNKKFINLEGKNLVLQNTDFKYYKIFLLNSLEH